MRKLLYYILFAFLISISVISCKKDDKVSLYLDIYPKDISIPAKVDTTITFTINLHANKELKRFILKELPSGASQITLLDTAIGGSENSIRYLYKVKQTDAGKELSFIFTVNDQDGNSAEEVRKIVVVNSAPVNLSETGSFYIYSLYSNNVCAYDIYNGNGQYIAADSAFKDIQDDTKDTVSTKNLSHNWVSPSGCTFAVVNGFDYANATNVSAKEAFNAGTKFQEVHNIAIGDIIIAEVKRKNLDTKYIVIKVTSINDNPGIKNDFYTFYLKK